MICRHKNADCCCLFTKHKEMKYAKVRWTMLQDMGNQDTNVFIFCTHWTNTARQKDFRHIFALNFIKYVLVEKGIFYSNTKL